MTAVDRSHGAPAAGAGDRWYRLDARDIIVAVGGDWDQFLKGNGGKPSVLSGRIEGSSLFASVTGRSTSLLLKSRLDLVRLVDQARTFRYRCDAPGHRRTMEMTISPERDGGLLLSHRLLEERQVAPAVEFRVAPIPHSKVVFRCSWCNRVKQGSEWLEPSAALPPAPKNVSFTVAYAICGGCARG